MRRLYQIYDRVGGGVVGPILDQANDAAAIRAFRDALSDERSQLAKHPGDYDLLFLGEQTPDGVVNCEDRCVVVTGGAMAVVSDINGGIRAES